MSGPQDAPTDRSHARATRVAIFGMALCAAVAGFGRTPDAVARTGPATGVIRVGEAKMVVELPVGPGAVQQGLSERKAVARGTDGMIFRAAGQPGFGMHGMRFCLDFLWVSGETLIGVTENVCPAANGDDQPVATPPAPITAAVEVPAGWVEAHGVAAGDPVTPLVVSPSSIRSMLVRASGNERFRPGEIESVAGALMFAGVDPGPVTTRMQAANEGGVTTKEVRRIVRTARAQMAGDAAGAAKPSATSSR